MQGTNTSPQTQRECRGRKDEEFHSKYMSKEERKGDKDGEEEFDLGKICPGTTFQPSHECRRRKDEEFHSKYTSKEERKGDNSREEELDLAKVCPATSLQPSHECREGKMRNSMSKEERRDDKAGERLMGLLQPKSLPLGEGRSLRGKGTDEEACNILGQARHKTGDAGLTKVRKD